MTITFFVMHLSFLLPIWMIATKTLYKHAWLYIKIASTLCKSPKIQLNPTALNYIRRGGVLYSDGHPYYSIVNPSSLYRITCLYSSLIFDSNGTICSTPADVDIFVNANYVVYNSKKILLYSLLKCGRCDECIYDRQNDICKRALYEASLRPTTFFYTITYDNEHVPTIPIWSPERNQKLMVLCRRDVQLFHKRLRTAISRYIDPDLTFRVVYCGEYGKRTSRPHYHGLMFFSRSLTPKEQIKLFDIWYHRDDFQAAFPRASHVWGKSRGDKLTHQLEICRNSIASSKYISKYLCKQHSYGFDPIYKDYKQFVQCPMRKGLGADYIDLYRNELLNSDGSWRVNVNGSISSVGIPRYAIDRISPPAGKYYNDAYKNYISFKMLYEEYLKRLKISSDTYFQNTLEDYSFILDFQVSPRRSLREYFKYFKVFHVDCLDEQNLYLECLKYQKLLYDYPDYDQYIEIVDNRVTYLNKISSTSMPFDIRHSKKMAKVSNNLDYIKSKMYVNDLNSSI